MKQFMDNKIEDMKREMNSVKEKAMKAAEMASKAQDALELLTEKPRVRQGHVEALQLRRRPLRSAAVAHGAAEGHRDAVPEGD